MLEAQFQHFRCKTAFSRGTEAQLQAQFNAAQLAQLHADIKARAQLPIPTYEKLPRS
jgi:hypothetical protein